MIHIQLSASSYIVNDSIIDNIVRGFSNAGYECKIIDEGVTQRVKIYKTGTMGVAPISENTAFELGMLFATLATH